MCKDLLTILSYFQLLFGQTQYLLSAHVRGDRLGGQGRSHCRRWSFNVLFGKESALHGTFLHVDHFILVQDTHRAGYILLGHGESHSARLHSLAVNFRFMLLDVAANEAVPEAGLAQRSAGLWQLGPADNAHVVG
jgi:hypothetical protein